MSDTLVNFIVQATSRCPDIMGAAHTLYYHHLKIDHDRQLVEVERARAAMRHLEESFAALNRMYAPTESSTKAEREAWEHDKVTAAYEAAEFFTEVSEPQPTAPECDIPF